MNNKIKLNYELKLKVINAKYDRLTVDAYKQFQLAKELMRSIRFKQFKDPNFICKGTFAHAKVNLENCIRDTKDWLAYYPIHNYEITLTAHHKVLSKPFKQIKNTRNREENLTAIKRFKEDARLVIKETRANKKELDLIAKSWTDKKGNLHTYYLVGRTAGVHQSDKEILKLQNAAKIKQCYEYKNPKTEENHLGIELEFIAPIAKKDLAYKFIEAKLESYVTIKADGSIRIEKDNDVAHEVCVLIPESKLDILNQVCNLIRSVGGRVNDSCGTHVHLDARNRNKELLFSNLVSAQNILYKMNPKYRLDGAPNSSRNYCKKTGTKRFTTSMDRYHGINGRSYGTHKTIEVRIHAGMLDGDKVIKWCQVLLTIANKPDAVVRAPITVKGFVKIYNVQDTNVTKFVKERIELFQQHPNLVEVA